MLNCNIPNALYFALLLGSACYAAPLSSTPTPQALAQVSYGNSSEYHHSTRLYHQRSTKSVVPMYKMLRHGLVSELMVELPEYIEPRTQYRIDIANEAKHLEMAGTYSDSYGDVKQSERKLSRRDLQSDASNIFRRYYKRPQKRTGTSTVPTATRPADGYFLKVVQSVNLTTSDIATITQSSIESASSISTSGPDAQATQTLVSTSVEDSATTPSSTIASETTETTALPTVTEQATASSTDQTTISTETSDVATTSTTDSATETPLSQLQYWGGTMMVDPVNVYHIYYGNWSTNQRQVIDNFITNFPTSSYWKTILPTYKDNKGRTASTSATLKSSIVEDYSHGLVLDDQSVEDVISDMILSGQLGDPDPNGVYMLMTDKDVQQTSGFCETYCGYHDFFEVQGVQIKYGYMGDPANCIAGCSPANPVNSPNNDPGLDSVVSILLHELIEIITDPVPPTGWIDGFGNENGDLCAYSYGGVQRLSSGAFFNQVVGGRRYLVQLMWAMDVNGCRS